MEFVIHQKPSWETELFCGKTKTRLDRLSPEVLQNILHTYLFCGHSPSHTDTRYSALGRTGGGDDDGDENKCYYKTRRDQSIEGGIRGHCREEGNGAVEV